MNRGLVVVEFERVQTRSRIKYEVSPELQNVGQELDTIYRSFGIIEHV